MKQTARKWKRDPYTRRKVRGHWQGMGHKWFTYRTYYRTYYGEKALDALESKVPGGAHTGVRSSLSVLLKKQAGPPQGHPLGVKQLWQRPRRTRHTSLMDNTGGHTHIIDAKNEITQAEERANATHSWSRTKKHLWCDL